MVTRRQLLKLGAFTLAAAHVPRIFAEKIATKKILILGGTGFLGPPIVERALQRGHTVTLFNRGRSNADLFPNVEKIRGNREHGDLGGLTNNRRWDVVIDVWANDPAVVVPMANLLAKRTGYYHFVSRDFRLRRLLEDRHGRNSADTHRPPRIRRKQGQI